MINDESVTPCCTSAWPEEHYKATEAEEKKETALMWATFLLQRGKNVIEIIKIHHFNNNRLG